MENKLSPLKTKKRKHDLVMLPSYFKGIGFFVALLSGIALLLHHINGFGAVPGQPELFPGLTIHAVLLGLFLMALARDLQEDEQTQSLRHKSMASGFILATIYVIMDPFFGLMFREPYDPISGVQVMLIVLVTYLLQFSFEKLMR